MPLDWEIWVDEHISPIVAKWMKEHTGWDVKSFYTMNFKGLPDKDVYLSARGHGKVILVSKDTDFPELISRLGSPPKLINIRIGNCDNKILWNILKQHIQEAVQLLITTDVNIIEID